MITSTEDIGRYFNFLVNKLNSSYIPKDILIQNFQEYYCQQAINAILPYEIIWQLPFTWKNIFPHLIGWDIE